MRANDSRKTWKLINSLLNKNTKSEMPRFFKINDSTVSDSKEIVDAFNKYFVEIGPRLEKKISPPKSGHVRNNIQPIRDTLVILPADPQEIYNIILNLKSSSSCGVDQIPVSVVKSVAEHISSPLT